jgi:hypothetical protein
MQCPSTPFSIRGHTARVPEGSGAKLGRAFSGNTSGSWKGHGSCVGANLYHGLRWDGCLFCFVLLFPPAVSGHLPLFPPRSVDS